MLLSGSTTTSYASFYIELEKFLLFTLGGESLFMDYQACQKLTRLLKFRNFSQDLLRTSKLLKAREGDGVLFLWQQLHI